MSKSVVIVGASADRRKFGNKAVRAYQAAGYEIFPVHPSEPTVEGVTTFPSIAAIPREHFDRVTFYVPPKIGITLLPELAAKSIGSLILNPGSESPDLLAKAEALGLPITQGCSIIMGGFRPEQFPDE